MNITALTICDKPYDRGYHGVQAVVHAPGGIRNAAEAQTAWFDAVAKVETEHFFYLDDDDDLPQGYAGVLELAVSSDADLVYTDELVRSPDRPEYLRLAGEYSQAAHLANFMLVHHLAVCRTAAARAAIARLPRGHYWPEMMLFWEMAKAGAVHLPAVGYVWNRRPTGLHVIPSIVMGQTRSALWCKDHP